MKKSNHKNLKNLPVSGMLPQGLSIADLLLTVYKKGEDNIDNNGNKISEKGAEYTVEEIIMALPYGNFC